MTQNYFSSILTAGTPPGMSDKSASCSFVMGHTPTNIQEEEHPHTQIYSCNNLNSKPFDGTDLTATIAQNYSVDFPDYLLFPDYLQICKVLE